MWLVWRLAGTGPARQVGAGGTEAINNSLVASLPPPPACCALVVLQQVWQVWLWRLDGEGPFQWWVARQNGQTPGPVTQPIDIATPIGVGPSHGEN